MQNFADAFAHHHSLHRATKCRVMCKTLKQTVGELKAIFGHSHHSENFHDADMSI